jgi:hypothetical protein
MQVSCVDPGKMRRGLLETLIHLPARRNGQVGHKVIRVENKKGVGNSLVKTGDEPGDLANFLPVDILGNEKCRGREKVFMGIKFSQHREVLESALVSDPAKGQGNIRMISLEIELHRAAAPG